MFNNNNIPNNVHILDLQFVTRRYCRARRGQSRPQVHINVLVRFVLVTDLAGYPAYHFAEYPDK